MAHSIGEVTVAIPAPKTRALRQFASQYEDWVTESIKNYSANLYQSKVDGKWPALCIEQPVRFTHYSM
jgi:hypothetical protein